MRTLNERFGDDITIHGPDRTSSVRGGVVSASPSATSTPTTCRQVLDQRNVCVRAGHHCAKPLMRVLGVERHRSGAASTCTTTTPTSTPWPTRSTAPADYLRSARAKSARPPCPASKTSTARSSSTTTATRATAASSRPRRPHAVEGHNPLCGDEIDVYLEVEDGVVSDIEGRRPGLLDQPSLGVDDVGQAVKGKTGRRGADARPGVQGDDVDRREQPRGRRRRARRASTT